MLLGRSRESDDDSLALVVEAFNFPCYYIRPLFAQKIGF